MSHILISYACAIGGMGILAYSWVAIGSQEDVRNRNKTREESKASVAGPAMRDKHEQMREIIRRAAESKEPIHSSKQLRQIAEQVKNESKRS